MIQTARVDLMEQMLWFTCQQPEMTRCIYWDYQGSLSRFNNL